MLHLQIFSLLASIIFSMQVDAAFLSGTLIKTPTGLCVIDHLKVGDAIVGYDEQKSLITTRIHNLKCERFFSYRRCH